VTELQEVPEWVVRFECQRCGGTLEFDPPEDYFDDDSEQYTGIAIKPHACRVEELIELCTLGGEEEVVIEDDLYDLLATGASKMCWHLEEANELIQRLRSEGRTDRSKRAILPESADPDP
jgi:hypothetical protein